MPFHRCDRLVIPGERSETRNPESSTLEKHFCSSLQTPEGRRRHVSSSRDDEDSGFRLAAANAALAGMTMGGLTEIGKYAY
jgi:hypothetical protein